MQMVHDYADTLQWNNSFRPFNSMPKHGTRSNNIRKLLRAIHTSLSFQILAQPDSITAGQNNGPYMVVLFSQKGILARIKETLNIPE